MKGHRVKNTIVLTIALLLASLGLYNIYLKATWSVLDDGVFWKNAPEGVVAGRVAGGGPAALAGIQPGDILMALDGEEVFAAADVENRLAHADRQAPVHYLLLRADER